MKKLLVALGALALLASMASGSKGPHDQYVGGGTLVVKGEGQSPVVDQGNVVCNKSSPTPSVGGGCVAFGPWNSVLVTDGSSGTRVAFQVCIDNNGDSLCGGGQDGTFDPCADQIFFSHDDHGTFYNPLGPLPTSFKAGCPGGPWAGYVVFLCAGVHNAGTAHQHAVTAGTITGVMGGSGFGDFCSPPDAAPPKQYTLQ